LNKKQKRYTCKIVNESGRAILAIISDKKAERIPVREANRMVAGVNAGTLGGNFERANETDYGIRYPESMHDSISPVPPHNFCKTLVDNPVIGIRILFWRRENEYSDLGELQYNISKSHVYVTRKAYRDDLQAVQVSFDPPHGNIVIRSLPIRPWVTSWFGG
jgi:hypothetical protein